MSMFVNAEKLEMVFFLNKLHLKLSIIVKNAFCSHLVKMSLKANIYYNCWSNGLNLQRCDPQNSIK